MSVMDSVRMVKEKLSRHEDCILQQQGEVQKEYKTTNKDTRRQ